MKSMLILLTSVLFLVTPASAQQTSATGKIHETYIFEGLPTADVVSRWSSHKETHSYLFQIDAPSSEELSPLLALKADLIQLQTDSYPLPEAISTWKALAQKGAQFVGRDLQLPTEEQISLFNEIGFSRVIFLISYIPDLDESARLSNLAMPVSVTLATANYPRYDDKELLLGFPDEIPLTWVGAFFPWYTHMDLFNMIPNPQRLRVNGTFPSTDHFEYLNNIKRLEEITIEASYTPAELDIWARMGNKKVTWISKDWVPPVEAIHEFAKSNPEHPELRRLVIDQDFELLPEERSVLRGAGVPVEWVHAVNFE